MWYTARSLGWSVEVRVARTRRDPRPEEHVEQERDELRRDGSLNVFDAGLLFDAISIVSHGTDSIDLLACLSIALIPA